CCIWAWCWSAFLTRCRNSSRRKEAALPTGQATSPEGTTSERLIPRKPPSVEHWGGGWRSSASGSRRSHQPDQPQLVAQVSRLPKGKGRATNKGKRKGHSSLSASC